MRLLYNRKQPYYCEVEYLDFAGTQHLETDLFSASDLKVECICSSSTASGFNNALFGGRESNAVKSFTVWRHLNSSASPRFDFNNTQRYASEDLEADVWYKITKDGADNYVDGVAQASNPDATFESETTKIIIGGVRTGTSTFSYNHYQGKIKSAKCWKAGVLVRDFIPVLDYNKIPCMYDKVSGQLFYNQGTGTFLYGREIHPVEYIKGTGTQYFDSGVATSTTTITECDCQYDPEAEYIVSTIFGSGTVAETSSDRFQTTFGSNGTRITARICSATQIVQANAFERHVIRLDPIDKRFYVDNDYNAISYSGTLNNTTITYFVRKMNSSADMEECTKMIFYAGKIWDGELLVRDFIPAIDETGKAFAFDRVEHTIHDNKGTGEFLYGKVENTSGLRLLYTDNNRYLPYKCEVEYLESTGTQYIDTGISKGSVSVFRMETIMSLDDNTTTNAVGYGATVGGGNFGFTSGSNIIFYNLTGTDVNTNFSYTVGNKYNFDLNGISGYFEIKDLTGNVLYSAEDTASTQTSNASLMLFGYVNKSGAQPRAQTIYQTKLYKNNVLVRDFIPVLDWNDVPCMYDKVSGELFYNAGTGDFLYGREIHPVEYLESTGTQYVETEVVPTTNTGLNIDYAYPQIGSQAAGVCGTYKGTSPRQDTLFVSTANATTNSNLYLFHRGVSLNIGMKPEAGVFYNGKINWLNDGKLNFNNGEESSNVGTNAVISQAIRLFSRYNNANGTWANSIARIKAVSFSEGSEIIKDFIPAIDENGVGFMFDRITHTIYDNKGTGSFAYGSVVPVSNKKYMVRFLA